MQITKTNAILGGAVVVLLLLFFTRRAEVETVETTRIEYIQQEDEIHSPLPVEVKLTTIKIPVPVKVIESVPFEVEVEKVVYKDRETKEFKFVDTLKNGIVTSWIVADKIFDRRIKLQTEDKVVTQETVRTFQRTQLFFGGTMTFREREAVSQVTGNAFLQYQNKFLLTVGGGYNFDFEAPVFTIGVGFKF